MADAPYITPLPPAPLPTDSPSSFNAKAFVWVAALDQFIRELNALIVWMNENVFVEEGGGPVDVTSDQFWEDAGSYSWTGAFWYQGSNQWSAINPTTDSGDSGFGWQVGFRPTSLELTVHAVDPGENGFGSPYSFFELRDTMENVIAWVNFDFSEGASQTKTVAITFSGFDIGQLYQSGYVYAYDSGPHIDSIVFS